jgi:hypothetical protein
VKGNWKDEWGIPVNQEDLVGTLCVFTGFLTKAIEDSMHIQLDEEGKECYQHLWRHLYY